MRSDILSGILSGIHSGIFWRSIWPIFYSIEIYWTYVSCVFCGTFSQSLPGTFSSCSFCSGRPSFWNLYLLTCVRVRCPYGSVGGAQAATSNFLVGNESTSCGCSQYHFKWPHCNIKTASRQVDRNNWILPALCAKGPRFRLAAQAISRCKKPMATWAVLICFASVISKFSKDWSSKMILKLYIYNYNIYIYTYI